jgi:N utilization substance protein B
VFQLDINPPVEGAATNIEYPLGHGTKESDNSIGTGKKAPEALDKNEGKTESPTAKDLKTNNKINRDLTEKQGEDYDNLDFEIERAIDLFKANFKTDETAIPFFLFLVRGVCKHKEEIDRIINETSENWKLDRMGIVDRNILRFAIFELMFADDIPSNVSMNEAIEIAKRYGTADSPSFINGILDKIASLQKSNSKKGKAEADID